MEIGGSFRMPEIMAASGAILREVGTTNKTYLRDFEQAVTSETAVPLKVHPSNYRIMGFTHEVTLGEMVDLGRRYGLKIVEDLGSGCLVDLSKYGLESEPTVQETLKSGADLVLFPATSSWADPRPDYPGKPRSGGGLAKKPVDPGLSSRQNDPDGPGGHPTALPGRAPGPHNPHPQDANPAGGGVAPTGPPLARRVRRRFAARLQVEVVKSEGRAGAGLYPRPPCPAGPWPSPSPPLAPQELEVRLRQAK